jgi:hypothetical protein
MHVAGTNGIANLARSPTDAPDAGRLDGMDDHDRGSLPFDLPAAAYAPRMARVRAESVAIIAADAGGDLALVLAEMVAEAIEHGHLAAHERIEVRISWDPQTVRFDVCFPSGGEELATLPARGPAVRDAVVSDLAGAGGEARRAGLVRRWAELSRGARIGGAEPSPRP